jgi:hypothetical protein
MVLLTNVQNTEVLLLLLTSVNWDNPISRSEAVYRRVFKISKKKKQLLACHVGSNGTTRLPLDGFS